MRCFDSFVRVSGGTSAVGRDAPTELKFDPVWLKVKAKRATAKKG